MKGIKNENKTAIFCYCFLQNIGQYEPASEVTLYATIGALACLSLISIILAIFHVPSLNNQVKKEEVSEYAVGKCEKAQASSNSSHQMEKRSKLHEVGT